MSQKDKRMLNMTTNEYLTKTEGQFVVKRFIQKHGNTPISFFDLLRDGDNLSVVIGTRSGEDYRGKGYARKLSEKGMAWVNNNKDKWDNVSWGVNRNNEASIKLAKSLGFELDYKTKNKEWQDYLYKQQN